MTPHEPDPDRVIALLEAILSEQRAMGARQSEAIENQRRAIEMQRDATRRASRILYALTIALVVVILVAYFGSDLAFWYFHH